MENLVISVSFHFGLLEQGLSAQEKTGYRRDVSDTIYIHGG